MENGLKVGELARRTGLTVRTLHHYGDIGLLTASRRTRAGHRIYDVAEIRRLQQISALRQLGLSLDAIRECLDGGRIAPIEIVSRQIAQIEARIEAELEMVRDLRRIEDQLRNGKDVGLDDLLHTIRETVMFEKYYTKEQLEKLAQQGEKVGSDRIAQVQQEWADLFKGMEDAMNAGTDPSHPSVQALARQAVGLIGEFTGGDPGIEKSLGEAYRQERPAMQQKWGMSEELGAYYGRAMAALKAAG